MEINIVAPLSEEEITSVVSIAKRRVGEGLQIDPVSYAILMKADMNELTRQDTTAYFSKILDGLKQRVNGRSNSTTHEASPTSPFQLDY
jgi:hypothetical protein